jgi:hypothetical protein
MILFSKKDINENEIQKICKILPKHNQNMKKFDCITMTQPFICIFLVTFVKHTQIQWNYCRYSKILKPKRY